MALLAQGIVGGDMAWPLVVVGILMGFALIMVQVKSPMLFAVGMYLPLDTTFAIFLGGIIRWITDKLRDRRGLNDAQKARVENAGVLTASGLIAGEAMTGLVVATFRFFEWPLPEFFKDPSILAGFGVLALLAFVMVRVPSQTPVAGRSGAAHGDYVGYSSRSARIGSTPAALLAGR